MNSEKEKEIKKALECCVNYAKLQVKSEQFERNMKNVLEIEKKQAVKEFAEKLKKKVHNYYPSIDSYCTSKHVILVKDIDELLKSTKMVNHCEDCEHSNDCEIAYMTEFCEDCKDYYTCNILSECKAGYSVECNNGFEPKNDYADDYNDEDL